MIVRPGLLFAIIWIGWIVSWLAAAWWSAPTEKRIATRDAWVYRAFLFIGALLLTDWTVRTLAERRLWHVGFGGAYALAGLTLVGVLFAWWARLHLGRLWSGAVTRKEGHRIVDTGPYALVRHPIYTGLVVAIVATAVAQATATSLIGAALIVCAFTMKARIEERFLTTELDPDAYGAYRRRVPMLIPFLPVSSSDPT